MTAFCWKKTRGQKRHHRPEGMCLTHPQLFFCFELISPPTGTRKTQHRPPGCAMLDGTQCGRASASRPRESGDRLLLADGSHRALVELQACCFKLHCCTSPAGGAVWVLLLQAMHLAKKHSSIRFHCRPRVRVVPAPDGKY